MSRQFKEQNPSRNVAEDKERSLDKLLGENARSIAWHNKPMFAMCAPYFLANDIINNAEMGDITKRYGPVDKDKALEQFNTVYSYVSSRAWVHLIPSVPGLQDQVYVTNVAAIFDKTDSGIPSAVLSNFRAPGRAGEELIAERFLKGLGYETVHCPYLFEGEADLKPIAPGVFVGAVARTSAEAHDWIANRYGVKIIKCENANPYLIHLDCVLFRLDDERVMLATEALDPGVVKEIAKYCDIIDVPLNVAFPGATNGVRIGNEIFLDDNSSLIKDYTEYYENELKKLEFFERVCTRYGKKVKFFNCSEFLKSGAGLSCMFLKLNSIGY